MGLRLDHPGQLHDCQVVAAVLGVPQRLVECLDVLALDLQLSGLALNLVQVVVRQVFLRLQIQADHPLDQGVRHLPALIVDQPQKISGASV